MPNEVYYHIRTVDNNPVWYVNGIISNPLTDNPIIIFSQYLERGLADNFKASLKFTYYLNKRFEGQFKFILCREGNYTNGG